MPPDAPYRDDREADRARIEALENDLAAAKDKIAALEGKQSQALVLAGRRDLTAGGKPSAGTRFLGAPLHLELRRTWDTEYPIDNAEDLLVPIRSFTRDNGRTEMLKTSMTWFSSKTSSAPASGVGPFYEVRISVRNGSTTLTVTDELRQLAGVLFGAIGVGVGFGGAMTALPFVLMTIAPFAAPLLAIAWMGSMYGGIRALFQRKARKRAAALQQLFDRLCIAIEADLKSAN